MQSSLTCPIVNLDALVNSALFRAGKLNPTLKLSQARDVLRLLLYKFFWQQRFNIYVSNPWAAFAQVSQAALAAKLGLSREWVNKLCKKLKAAKWIETHAPRRPDGKLREVTTFRPGALLRQLLMSLLKSKQRDTNHVNDHTQVFSDSHADEHKETDKQTLRPIPPGLVDGLVEGLVKNMDMNTKTGW